MLPRFSTASIASRLVSGALLLAVLTPVAASAQAPGGAEPFDSVVDSSAYLGQTPLRIWQRTRGFGEETAETMLGTHWAAPLSMGLAFVDGNLRIGNSDTDFSVNFGAGFRWRNDDFFTDSPRIFGFSVWYDGEDTQLDNYFNQIGLSFERLGPLVDLRLNVNIPLEDVKQGDDVTFTGDTIYNGFNISQGTLVSSDVSLRVVDFEVAPRLFNLNAWGYGGGYQMDGQGVSELGYKAGVRGYLLNDLALDVGVHDDDLFGTNTVVQIIWTPGRVSADASVWTHNIDDRMREQVFRNPYVAVTRSETAGAVALTDATGNDIRVVHVDSTAAAGGDGSFENPLNNLGDIQGNSEVGDIILVHSQSTFTGQNATLQDAQRFLGEGLNNAGEPQVHTVFTSELGLIDLPETAPGASSLARPIINNASGDAAVILAGMDEDVENLTEMEVSNFTITGGTRGVYSPGGVADVNINQLNISGTTGDAIELTPLIETLANNSERIRFTPTIDDVVFNNIGGDDIDLNATTMEPASTAIAETITISQITSTNGNGVGIRLTEHKRAATITDFDWDGGATGDGALLIDNTLSQGTVNLSGMDNQITGGQVGSAFAIRLEGGAATHTVAGTTITDMGGDAIVAIGPGTAGMNFTGRIEQTVNNAAILNVSGGHDGNMTFTELTAGAGVINATTGTGLQFNDADGVYTFNDNVNIEGAAGSGATAGVNVIGDSSGVITLTDATFNNINGDSVRFVGGTANMTFTGRITQTANAQSIVDVSGGHDGTLAFNQISPNTDVINATMGDGLQFNNADGAYTFNDAVVLTGTTAGINVTGGSDGTLAFTDTATNITNATGVAVNIENSAAIFTYAGEINTDNTAGRPVRIAGNTGGSITFSGEIDSTDEGILVENNTGGSRLFSGQVTLNTGTNHGVTIQNNTVAGSTRFNNLDVTTTTGTGFLALNNASPVTIEVAGTGNTIATTGGVGLSLSNVNVGTAGVNFATVDVTNATGSGIILSNVTGGSVTVNGGTISGAQANAVDINNVANVTLNSMSITGTNVGFDAIEIDHSNNVVSNVTLNNLTIDSGLSGIDYNRLAGATITSRLLVSNVNINNTTGQGIDIDIEGSSDANITINNGTIVSTDDDEALAFNTTGGVNKTVRVLVDGSTFNNNSATLAAVNFNLAGTGTINANITDNSFDNPGAGRGFIMSTNSPATNARLNLDGNIANSGAANDYLLDENSGDFDVVDLSDVSTRNTGAIEIQGTLDDIPGPVPLPTSP